MKEILREPFAYTVFSRDSERMESMVRKYFAGANTASGFINLLDNNLDGVEKIYVVSGSYKKAKSELFKYVVRRAEEKYGSVECIINPFDIADVDGVIIRDIKTALVDKDLITGINDAKKVEIPEGETVYSDEISRLSEKEMWALGKMYGAYRKGKEIHDEWEQIYMKNMDYSRLEAYENGIINQLINKTSEKIGTQNVHRFFGASTPDGSVNYIDNLTENLSFRYFIKGRPGTGKSTFLKRVVKCANEKGYDTEIYYCSFDKDSLDMVIVPKLDFCVFDSTAPHEMFPQTERDKILDFYKESGLLGVDEKYERMLSDVGMRYKHRMSEGMAYLRLAKLYRNEREYYLGKNVNERELDVLKETLADEILGT